ncbi:endonuclease/exonuclease/phosphatase family protein [Engelhardtia mirabilis]|uniref:Endonuclease/exonuclease/phosphatase domain-containing protein n=1 Tax=Engelhardtia mirabilis TaxID=2528011 RepID=A0A518BE10_9BACT|nr:hypothetical protein Pla133_02750 [Planctomycetes bacterium Pla133]QDU99537.1 hypothetical protein Pla86_02750 [Planctomycetes bacterium Pla86]
MADTQGGFGWRREVGALGAALMAFLGLSSCTATGSAGPGEVRVLTWNIWHGGREDGAAVGPVRVAEVIADSGADIVAMQETYGSGPRIATALGFHLQLRGTNVSIHSRYPILEDISVFEEFKCAGALIELPDRSRLALYSIWLPYDAEIWEEGTRDSSDPQTLLAACQSSARDLEAMRLAIEERLAGPDFAGVPIVIAGDFNSMSHLDYGEVGFDQYGVALDWPTSRVLTEAGFLDAYRECNPSIDRAADSTWTPRFPEQEQDRIDFVYYRADGWRAVQSRIIREHREGFPSDHAALLTVFQPTPVPLETDEPLRVVSYNIRHGVGLDDQLDLERTAGVLRDLAPDFVGLQEVDLDCERSGGVNQVHQLAAELAMHPAFGGFMDYQGGRYGMGILSRHPIVDAYSLRLPDGNEPRVALVVEAQLPGGERVLVVSVHFDWVEDDAFRFAQATALAEFLADLGQPYILLGDFNDGPNSRTLGLFRALATEAAKPPSDPLTFPADGALKEIDFVFCSPPADWSVESVDVIDEPLASDHRPVLAELRLLTR